MNKTTCPCCSSENVSKVSRIVGYFSKVDNWSKSKQEEKKKRQLGKYEVEDKQQES